MDWAATRPATEIPHHPQGVAPWQANTPDKIKTLPLFDGRFDAYKLEAKDSDVLFASYPAGTTIPRSRMTPTTTA